MIYRAVVLNQRLLENCYISIYIDTFLKYKIYAN